MVEEPKKAPVEAPIKAMSPNCQVKVAGDEDRARFTSLRMKMSKEEMEVINTGGENVSDWRKIKI